MEDDFIRIIHFADTHLGFSAYRRVDQDGVNKREKDVYDAFSRMIDYIIETRPDIVIHAGDLFDNVRPTNRAIGVALNQLSRLSKEEIPTVVISGNHETPKLKETGHIFKTFEHLDYIFPVYGDKEEIIKLNIRGYTVKIHAVPHCRSKEDFLNALERVEPDERSDYNILVTHGAFQSIQGFRMNEFNEYIIPMDILRKDFDYIALGHFHRYAKVTSSMVYPGSIEKFSFAESRDVKGLVEVVLSDDKEINFVPFPTRKMIEVDPINCKGLSTEQVMNKIEEALKDKSLKEAIVRINLHNIDDLTYRNMDQGKLKTMLKDTFHFEIRRLTGEDPGRVYPSVENVAIRDLITEFRDFLNRINCEDKEKFFNLGRKYLEEMEE